MDAVKFIKERDRMCRFYHHAGDCYQCPDCRRELWMQEVE